MEGFDFEFEATAINELWDGIRVLKTEHMPEHVLTATPSRIVTLSEFFKANGGKAGQSSNSRA